MTDDDFVYAVALSADAEFCVFGGTSKHVVVLEARSGKRLWQIGCSGTIWSISLVAGTQKMAIGGEFGALQVYDAGAQRLELQLPVDEIIYSSSTSHHSLCFCNGSQGLPT